MHRRLIPFWALLLIFSGCSNESAEEAAVVEQDQANQQQAAQPPNFLILIADDMGVETLQSYGIGEITAFTPNLDRLAQGGMQFNNHWVQPSCSPTRATLLTGRYGFRTDMLIPTYPRNDLIEVDVPPPAEGAPVELQYSPFAYLPPGAVSPTPPGFDFSQLPTDGLPEDEITLPQVLKSLPSEYATAAIGKWHLADSTNGWLSAPKEAGFDYYSGLFMGVTDSYFDWLHVEQGVATAESGYLDERVVEDSVRWIGQQAENDKPWLLWTAFFSPHYPITLPPSHLLRSEASLALSDSDLNPDNTRPYVMAMIEALDTLIGQLLQNIPESERDNTYIVFLGDNGSVKWAQPAPPVDPMRAKLTLYEGGVRTPLLVAGPGVSPGQTTDALVNSVDLFSTILDLAGTSAEQQIPGDIELDSVTYAPLLRDPDEQGLRNWIYADSRSLATGQEIFAIRDDRFKLIQKAASQELYDLLEDPWENNDLMQSDLGIEQREAVQRLAAYAESLRNPQ